MDCVTANSGTEESLFLLKTSSPAADVWVARHVIAQQRTQRAGQFEPQSVWGQGFRILAFKEGQTVASEC